jgi:vitamin B12 transporter
VFIMSNVFFDLRGRTFARACAHAHLLHPTPAAFAAACLALSLGAQAQAAAPSVASEQVVVTANRWPQPLSTVLTDISVIDRTAIERTGAFNLAEVLARLPGIEFTRNGGAGGTTGVFIRGGESRHAAVYLDGVRIDSQATGGAFWEQIPLELIDRIEVLRGPAAAMYGSDAIAGVVQLFTRRGQNAFIPNASFTAGSDDTQQGQVGLSGTSGALDYALSASLGRSTGFNARTTTTANPDTDGWRRSSANARVGLQLQPQHRVDLALLSSRLRAQFDGFSPGVDDLNLYTLTTASATWLARWNDTSNTRVSVSQTESSLETQPSFYRTETTLRNFTLQHEQRVGAHAWVATLERREDELFNPATAFAGSLQGQRHQDGIGFSWHGNFGSHGIQAHVRHDQDSEFGGKSTGSLAWGWRFLPQWRLTASAATSFRAPTLYQRFSQYGTASLVPESGRNAEVGVSWAAAGTEASLRVWRNQVSNLINFGAPGPCVDSFGCYENVGRARLEGVTLSGKGKLGAVSWHGSLNWHDPRNTQTDKLLQRRARQLATVGADTSWAGWTWGAEVQAVGARFEDAANTQRMGGYGLLNLVASTPLLPGLMLQARVDNVADKAYELAQTYATAGRTAQLSLRWTLP